MEEFGRAGQATDDSTAHALCMLDNKATDAHSEYVVCRAFALQQWFNITFTRTLPVVFYFLNNPFMWRSCLVCVRE